MPMREIILIPEKVHDEWICFDNATLVMLVRRKQIPYLIATEKENFFHITMDRHCPCECDKRYVYRKIEKQDIDDFITSHLVLSNSVKIFDN
jgi:hypothetical protein